MSTWTTRALSAVDAGIEQAKILYAGNYLTSEERTLWANEAKRLYGVKVRLTERLYR